MRARARFSVSVLVGTVMVVCAPALACTAACG
jgi:hypothetical protein